ncbi:unnamed protein product [Moneuplotes crassus]|uniref:Uncharacterized protein n=1 Tax=Euplotes crassus TaxID=5936 RepID=A0AAD2CXV1_EUPCR|nr:unnamed protein product [Moneuplotes crassus]
MEEVYEKLSQENKDRIEKIFGSLDNILQPPSYKCEEDRPLVIYSIAMSVKSETDLTGLRVIQVKNPTAPKNFEDMWGFNFIRLLSDAYISSGANLRTGAIFPTKFENYGFDVELDDGTPMILHRGKKRLAIRTRKVDESKEHMTEYYKRKPALAKYYNWTLYTEEAKLDDEHVQYLENNELHSSESGSSGLNIVEDLYLNKGCQTVIAEAGPKTCHKYFKKGQAAQNPFDVIYLALHFGVVDKENLVYGDECAIDFLAPEEAEDSEYNLRDGFEIVHEQDEEVGGAKWRYYVLHKKV